MDNCINSDYLFRWSDYMNLINFLQAIGIVLFAFIFQTSLTGINRKITARIQRRRGPVWYQQFLDIFKALTKTSITHGWIYDFGVIMALGGIAATLMMVPIAGFESFPGMDNIFIITYLLAVGMLGMAMSASGSGNPWAAIGVSRALTSMLAYDIPFMLVMIGLIFKFDTASLSNFAALQQTGSIVTWNIIRYPIGGFVALISLQGMLGKKPFDNFIAPAEIASGPMVEYGGKHLGMLFILHELSTFIEVGLIVNIFFGGGPTVIAFLVKYVIVYTLTNMVSQVLARFKVDQMVMFYYKVPLTLAFIQGFIIVITNSGGVLWF